ncbi:MAG: PLP-dependent transferase [Bacteroidetes bacterium]|nr:PLP-dependent transferase [Bacteroidota bacterium]
MKKIPQHIPCGTSIPIDNPHAVSVSLPTIADVIGYESKNPYVMQKLQSGYPRFFMNKLIHKVQHSILETKGISSAFDLIPVSSPHAVSLINNQLDQNLSIISDNGFDFIQVEKETKILSQIKSFIQNNGLNPSSRKGENYLLNQGILSAPFDEERNIDGGAEEVIKKTLAEAYEISSSNDVILCNTGMNAVYTAFEAIRTIQIRKGKTVFIQLGWLYLDTIEIIKKYSNDKYFQITSNNLDELESWLAINHADVAGLITEVPNNPLIQCLDLPRLRKITQKYNVPLIIDATIATPYNMEVLEYADIIAESLTKFACGNGDVMMGAIILNPKSEIAVECDTEIRQLVEKPYIKDIQRLAFKIINYKSRVEKISENTYALLDYLKHSKKITAIYSALNPEYLDNFLKVRKNDLALPGLISIIFDKKLHHYYDHLRFPKGPSFGTEFTLAMPYVYLAHFDLLQTTEGRQYLESIGLKAELLRVSVGTEPIEEIIKVFEEL